MNDPTTLADSGPGTVLDGLAVVLFRPKLSENIGAVARSCANMGCRQIVLVDPGAWDKPRAAAVATSLGAPLLDRAARAEDLSSALAPFTRVFGTTARTGGWRRDIASPETAASDIVNALSEGRRVALVFGPEDRGLTNQEIDSCSNLITIPTAPGAASLNLAQAVLVILYECFKQAVRVIPQPLAPGDMPVDWKARERLYGLMRETLLLIDFLKLDNADFWMHSVKRFLNKFELKRSEYDMLMGICRQVRWAAGVADDTDPERPG
jgi:tRNA/rRNA methyltransferase